MIHPIDVLQEFPVRKNKIQKQQFRQAILSYAEGLGYSCKIEKGSFGVHNILIGDPDRATYLVTAHYDTCAALPFPNLITPCNLGAFLLWQLLLVVVLCVPVGIIGGIIGYISNEVMIGIYCAYLLLIAEVIWMLVGPANRFNANDNTSGVVTVLETAAALPVELREQVCFVLFDLEEAGLLGSSSYRQTHRNTTAKQIVLNIDCVGEGNEILLFPTKKLKKNDTRVAKLKELCFSSHNKSIKICDKGFSIYPSDQSSFPFGLGIAAFCRSKFFGLYLAKIHTRKDRVLDEKNVALVRDYLLRVIDNHA